MTGQQQHTIRSFIAGRPAHSGALVSTGDRLYSYALLLAERYERVGDIYIVRQYNNSPRWYSQTTRRHLSAFNEIVPADGRIDRNASS